MLVPFQGFLLSITLSKVYDKIHFTSLSYSNHGGQMAPFLS